MTTRKTKTEMTTLGQPEKNLKNQNGNTNLKNLKKASRK
jgi:hypothetical protein